MTPAQALPLLEQTARWIKEYYDANAKAETVSSAYPTLVSFFKKTTVILQETDGISESLVESFTQERTFRRNGTSDHTYLYSIAKGYLALVTILQILKARAEQTPSTGLQKTPGSLVFIGHGRDPAWMELREFLTNGLHLGIIELNSTPTAGMTITGRLSVMLDAAGFAFLIMTAEDHVGRGTEATRVRQNVIHEIGLFQGRLGFDKAIILLEEGCPEFSNVAGLIYIPFPKGNIRAAFHDVQRTLTGAGLVKPLAPID